MISNELSQAIQRHWHTAVALSDDLYAHPEIAHQEFRSSQKVVELLRQAGYQVEYPYMGYPTAFRGVLKNGEGPSAAILVEYDALPGLGHACGHNAHCAMAVLAALALADILTERGVAVTTCDLTATHVSDALTQAFYCGKLVLAGITYDGGLFPPVEELLNHLKAKNFQGRKVGLMENGSWAPTAARLMRARLEEMKNITLCPTAVTIRSALNEGSRRQLTPLAEELL